MSGSSWSVSLGSWSGVQVRLHVTLPLFVLCALLMSEGFSIYTRASLPMERVAFIILLGLGAVAAHAISHVISAARHGIDTHELVLTPWGEAHPIQPPPTAEAALNMNLAGLMTNAFLCAVSAILLWLRGDTSISEMLVPLDSRLLLQENSHQILRWMFCLNYCLLLLNLIPAAPFDGGRILESILHLTLPHLAPDAIRHSVVVTGRIVGVLLIAVAIWLGEGDTRGLVPAWFPLAVLGVMAVFASEPVRGTAATDKTLLPPVRQQSADDAHDESGLATPELLDWEDGPFAQWLQEKKEADRTRREQRQTIEQAEDERADEILARLYQLGPHSLSAEDRNLLDRVSDRLRRRKQNK